jgi:polar amino acid transport system substrate-binding protein
MRPYAVVGALMLFCGAISCASAEERSTWDRVRSAGIVRVGYAVEPPFALVDSTGRISGESPELLRLVMADLGVDSIEWVATRFGSLIMELQRGDFDVIAAGMYVTPDRARSVLFSRPTLRDPTALLVRVADSSRLSTLDDFVRTPEARLAIISGAAEERLARSAGLAPRQLRAVPDPATGRAAVLSGEADAFALSTVSLSHLRRTRQDSSGLAVIPLSFTNDATRHELSLGLPAYAVRLDDTELRTAIDRALDRVLGTPPHRALQRQFGFDSSFDAPAGSGRSTTAGPP